MTGDIEVAFSFFCSFRDGFADLGSVDHSSIRREKLQCETNCVRLGAYVTRRNLRRFGTDPALSGNWEKGDVEICFRK